MSDSLTIIRSFVRKPLSFRCKPPTHSRALEKYPEIMKRLGPSPSPEGRCTVTVEHQLNGPASPGDLRELRDLLGDYAEPFATFYEEHDGFVLYKDPRSGRGGRWKPLSIQQWTEATEELRSMNEFSPPGDDPAEIMSSGIAFAHAPQSGNFFAVAMSGPKPGAIYYANHDGWYERSFAANFDDFIRRVTSNPVKLLSRDLGCYARYSDGTSNVQWIPDAVVKE